MARKYGYLLYFFLGVFFLFSGIVMSNQERITQYQQASANNKKNEMPLKIALTFDDGPSCCTIELLEGLEKRGVKASFFLLGESIQGREDVILKMHQEGHLIGNHTYQHVQLTTLSNEKACEMITKTANMIYEITGEYTIFVRPPYGEWKKGLDLKIQMVPVFWDIDSLDWTTNHVEAIVQRVVSVAKDGDIILMHDCYESSVIAAFEIIDQLKKEGYEFVTVDELIFR